MTAAAEFFSALPERLSAAGEDLRPAVIAFALAGAPDGGWTLRLGREAAVERRRRAGGRHGDVHAGALGAALRRQHVAADGLGDRPARGQRRHAAGAAAPLAAGHLRCAAAVAPPRPLSPCCSPAAPARPTSTAPCPRPEARRASSRSRSMRPARCSSARRSASIARPTAAGPGTRRSGTSGARSRLASPRPRRSSRAGGCCSAATSPTTTSTRPSARPSTAAACWRSAAPRRQALRARARHLLAPLRHARLGPHVEPAAALDLPRSARAIAVARAKGAPTSSTPPTGARASGARSTPA